MKLRIVILLFISIFILSSCAETSSFERGDKKNDFCGVHINFQYCKCAFHNDYCDSIGMSRGEAKKHVDKKYDEWVEKKKEEFKRECWRDEGIMKGDNCRYCDIDKVSVDNECVAIDSVKDDNDENEEKLADDFEGECKYDSDCDPICEGDILWKMGCNARTNTCEQTFDTDCGAKKENFGDLEFAQICQAGVCERDEAGIQRAKSDLEGEAKIWSDAVKGINAVRADINVAMLEANKNCINGIADMTNVAIVEFATRVGSVLAGGIPDVAAMTASAAEKASGLMQESVKNLAGAAVDYVGEGLNRLYNYQSGVPVEEEKKLKPHEYIKLNCDLYEYFKNVQAESDVELEIALQNAREVEALLNALP